MLDGKSKPQPPPTSPKRKAEPSQQLSQTPTKKVKSAAITIHAATPTRHESKDVLLSASKLFSPTHFQAMLGPTPQKDGIVLGLFDLLPAESPCKQRTVLGDIEPNHLQTPQKKRSAPTGEDEDDDNELAWSGKMARMGRTPVSEGKRHFLDQFATPQKRKRDLDEGTPSSRNQATTPVFLRRNFRPMPALAEQPTSPRVPRKPRSFMRSLSTMLQERRKEQQEDAEKEADAKRQAELEAEAEAEAELYGNDPDDDEEEAMREMEGETAPAPMPSTVLVEDSQFDMKLGADGDNVSDSETDVDDGLGRNGQPRKVWKKRGQKRSTKRVNMRPVIHKRQPQEPQQAARDSEDEDGDEATAIAETQIADQGEPASEDFNDSDATAVEDESDYGNASEHTPKKRKAESKKQPAKAPEPAKETGEKENIVKKAARKISAQAHANFRRLNIKNKNSKASGRGWGRNRR